MLTVYKYRIALDDYFEIEMPQGAQALTVKFQYGQAQLWALVNPEVPTQIYRFRVAGTGHPIKETNLHYIGTFQLMVDTLIIHVFEIPPKPQLMIERGKAN